MSGTTPPPTVRGPKITVSCRCGEKRYLSYGQRWTCENCGRTWDTRQIPADQYAAIRATQLRYRRVPLAISILALVCVVAGLLVGKVLGGLLIVAIVATTWSMFFRPIHSRKYRAALAQLPTWTLTPE
jgi:hypothetical protein